MKNLSSRLRPYVVDGVSFIHKAFNCNKRILIEGANALMLDLDFGTYPFVTSSSTSIGGVCTGLGIPPKYIGNVVGVVKAYTTRVGAGPFVTELLNVRLRFTSESKYCSRAECDFQDTGKHLQEVGVEYGVTTGRRRRCGWLDLVVIKFSHLINGYSSFNLTKLDVLDQLPEVKIAIKYEINGQLHETFPGEHHNLYSRLRSEVSSGH